MCRHASLEQEVCPSALARSQPIANVRRAAQTKLGGSSASLGVRGRRCGQRPRRSPERDVVRARSAEPQGLAPELNRGQPPLPPSPFKHKQTWPSKAQHNCPPTDRALNLLGSSTLSPSSRASLLISNPPSSKFRPGPRISMASTSSPATVIPTEPAQFTTEDTRRSSLNTREKREEKPNRSVTLPTDSEAETEVNEASASSYPPQRPSRRGTRESQPDGEAPSLKRRLTNLLVPEKPVKHEPTWRASFKAIVFASWLNLLLVFIPVSRACSRSLCGPRLTSRNQY